MAKPRQRLTDIFSYYLDSDQVYFEPPNDMQLKYPCIIYHLDGEDVDYSNNRRYFHRNRYSVLVISTDPDDKTYLRLLNAPELPYISHSGNRYVVDGLIHDPLTLYW